MSIPSLLFSALRSDLGITVQTSNPDLLRQQLYKARRADVPTFGPLSFVISPIRPQSEVWIIKRESNDAES